MLLILLGTNIVLFLLLVRFHLLTKRNQQHHNDGEFKAIVEMSTEPIFIHREGTLIYVNRSGARLLGLDCPERLLNRKLSEFIEMNMYVGLQRDERANLLTSREVVIQKTDGSRLDLATISSSIQFNGRAARKVTVRDITLEKKKTETLKNFAFTDELTGLLNRRGFVENVTQKIDFAKGTHERFGVMFIDLDGFKGINDNLGHQVGDLVLQRVGDYLQRCVRKEDLVARLGGDEFVILLPNATTDICIQLATRIIEPQSESVDIFGKGAYVTPSIGIAISPENGEDVETLIKEADLAMYESKKSGKNQYRFAESTLGTAE